MGVESKLNVNDHVDQNFSIQNDEMGSFQESGLHVRSLSFWLNDEIQSLDMDQVWNHIGLNPECWARVRKGVGPDRSVGPSPEKCWVGVRESVGPESRKVLGRIRSVGLNPECWAGVRKGVLLNADCRICVWNAADGSLVHSLTGHNESELQPTKTVTNDPEIKARPSLGTKIKKKGGGKKKKGKSLQGTVGSPFYIAPEVLAGGYNQAADVWSAGVILYILLSGMPPFWGKTKLRIFDSIKAANLQFPSDHISASAKDLITGMLCTDPTQRLTASKVLARIEDRISGWTFLPKENSETVQIMHYVHEDTRECLAYYGDKARLGFDESLMATVVLYLSNVSHGGETLFRKPEVLTFCLLKCFSIMTMHFRRLIPKSSSVFETLLKDHFNG
ncbi:hypothetical protein IFM89_015808 [Coptis chinensis]|uniref:Protein kinase domain-containing protein n=1 Tax=Coptis chinensis TaxID=261450 RepID=A0A835IN37_9MAGN|nr:hypothetical protein IFM89_015808 [Coptis chinensis]